MQHLFGCWTAIGRRLRTAPHILLFLDFDGTLAEIVPQPSLARMTAATRRNLSRLANHPSVEVCVISGRDRATLRKLVATPRVRCLGLYGWQNGSNPHLDPRTVSALAAAREEIAARAHKLAGVWVEDKGMAFAVHYRGASESAVRRLRHIVREVVTPLHALRVLRAKRAWDIVPAVFPGKGEAVRRQLAELPEGLPIYAGDDHADECAFNAIRSGISIHVGSRQHSCAQFCLRNPDEVRMFLEKLEVELSLR